MNSHIYKKISLKFCNEQYSRDVRHAEALKARESSRFKRLSMIRDINDSDLIIEEMEPVKTDETKKLVKPSVSRLDMLMKWKQEKQLKKELESKYKKKPFYVGGNSNQPTSKINKTPQNMPFSVDQTNGNFNASKVVKSKLLAVKAKFHPRKLPNISKQTNSAQKPLGFTNKGNNTATKDLPKTITKSYVNSVTTVNQTNSSQKPLGFRSKGNNATGLPNTKSYGNSVITVNPQCSIPKAMSKNEKTAVVKPSFTPIGMKVSKTSGTCPKTVNETSSIQKTLNKSDKVPPVKILLNGKTNLNPVKTINQESSLPTLTKFSNKSAQKGSFLPKIASAKFSNKSIPKLPDPSAKQKFIATPIFQKKETSVCARNIANKGYCFKEAVTGAQKKKELKNSLKEEFEKEIKNKHEVILPSEGSLLDFNCDVSIIKPSSKSFAPVDFEFNYGLSDFEFVNDEEDPYEALEHIKLKFMSRTSTPTKAEKSDKDSDIKEIKDNVREKDSIEEKYIDKENGVKEEKNIKEEFNKEIAESDILKMVKLDNNKAELVNTYEENVNEVNENEEKNIKEEINKEKENGESDILKMMKFDNNKAELLNTYEELSSCGSSLDIIDVNKFKEEFNEELELMNMEEEKVNIIDNIMEKPECGKPERKSASIVPKRVSMLKNMSTLNSIAEADDCPAECLVALPENMNTNITSRRSKRLSVSSRRQLDFLTEPIQEENLQSLPITPRRSLRLQKTKMVNLEHVATLPCEQKKSTPKTGPRRSIRLINLNTPETDANDHCSKSNLTVEFEKLNLLDSENTDPNVFLNDFDNRPSIATGFKPRKVSLLYTPEKKSKTMRKSIRGDLISFSPSK